MNFSGASYAKVPTWIVDSNVHSIHRGQLFGYVWKITSFKLVCICVAILITKCGNLYKKLLKADFVKKAFRFFDNCSLEPANRAEKLLGATFLVKFLISNWVRDTEKALL